MATTRMGGVPLVIFQHLCDRCHHTIRAALRAALPHLTTEDVPHLIREARAEAWEVGARTAWDRSTATVNGQNYYWRTSGEPANPYAEEAADDHRA